MPEKGKENMARYPKELRGNAIIGSHLVFDTDDVCFGQDPVPRKCSHCFFKPVSETNGRCNIIPWPVGPAHPHELFGIPDGESMPSQIDGSSSQK